MWYRKQEIIKMDKQIERAGDDNKIILVCYMASV